MMSWPGRLRLRRPQAPHRASKRRGARDLLLPVRLGAQRGVFGPDRPTAPPKARRRGGSSASSAAAMAAAAFAGSLA
jgi:hypothetical protein